MENKILQENYKWYHILLNDNRIYFKYNEILNIIDIQF